jgi:hypothetical protein
MSFVRYEVRDFYMWYPRVRHIHVNNNNIILLSWNNKHRKTLAHGETRTLQEQFTDLFTRVSRQSLMRQMNSAHNFIRHFFMTKGTFSLPNNPTEASNRCSTRITPFNPSVYWGFVKCTSHESSQGTNNKLFQNQSLPVAFIHFL